jgi:hypothetical protein
VKILSVQQPWSYLIAHGLKDVENRNWTTRYRGLVLIHAGKKFQDEAVDWILDRLTAGEQKRFPMRKSAFECGAIVGIARLADVVTESESKWFVGTYGWVFDKAMPLSPIPMRGSLGLIDAPAEIVAQVRAACEKAKVSA